MTKENFEMKTGLRYTDEMFEAVKAIYDQYRPEDPQEENEELFMEEVNRNGFLFTACVYAVMEERKAVAKKEEEKAKLSADLERAQGMAESMEERWVKEVEHCGSLQGTIETLQREAETSKEKEQSLRRSLRSAENDICRYEGALKVISWAVSAIQYSI